MNIASGTESYPSKFLHINISKQLKKRDYYYPSSPGQAVFSVEIQFIFVLVVPSVMSFHYFVYCLFSTLMVYLPTTCSFYLEQMCCFLESRKYLFENQYLAILFISFCTCTCMWTWMCGEHECVPVFLCVYICVCVHMCVQVCKHVYVELRNQREVFFTITSAFF